MKGKRMVDLETARRRLVARWHEQCERHPATRSIPLGQYVSRNIHHVMRNDSLREYDNASKETAAVTIEQTAIGPQFVIPGAERASESAIAQRRAAMPLKASKPQKALDFGLFGDESAQLDLVDLARTQK